MDTQDASTKRALKHSAANRYRSKSKDKLSNGKTANVVNSKYKINSRVPRIVRSPSNQCNTNKSTDKIVEKLDSSGDNKAGPSKNIHFLSKKDAVDKSKPSHIPRRKVNIKETPTREKPHAATPKKKVPQYIAERNIQRVQMLINQDYRPEEHTRVEPVARPIPTLGSIYARVANADTSIINDWFEEIQAPANSMASNVLAYRQTNETKPMPCNDAAAKLGEPSVTSALSSCISPHKHYSPSDNNSDWVADMEYPTRDNETGYHTSKPPTYTLTTDTQKSKQSNNTELDAEDSTSERINKLIRRATAQKDLAEKDSTVTEQPTVVLTKATPTLVLTNHSQKTETRTTRSDVDTQVKKCQYPPNSACSKISQINQEQRVVPSYIECLSEILQKTTNFEGDGYAETPNSLSSIAGTDLEIRDELSSECTLDDCSMCDHGIEWCHKCGKHSKPYSKKDVCSETTSIADSTLCHFNDDSIFDTDSVMLKDSVYNLKMYNNNGHQRCCWKKRSNHKGKYEKCELFKRFPSCRYKELTTFSSIRGRISLRICRRRLSRVWKKTTERWALWSAKPPQRFKKHRMMRYLQRSAIGEDANVQTNTFLFKETGTDSISKERRSQAIAVLPNFDSNFSYKSEIGTEATGSGFIKNKGRNCNLGPSLFPFFYNPERNAIIKHTIEANPLPKAKKVKYDTNDKETQKTENIQTESPKEDSQETCAKVSEGPENFIQICEITVDDKVTGTEDMPPHMQEQVTSTLLHLDAIRMLAMPQNANTQMWIVCNDQETNVRYPYSLVLDGRDTEVSTANSENLAFFRTCGISTEPKLKESINVMTSPNMMKTFISNEVQVASPPTPEKLPAETSTSNQLTNNLVENNQMMFIPVTPMRTIAAATSKKEYMDTGLMVFNSKLNSGVCLTSPSLQICHCPIAAFKFKSCGTDTDEISIETNSNSKSATKLKTYVNTGMLINAIVEKAVLRASPKFSIFTDTKSIGSKYTSDIGICTNTILKDSIIETEKEIHPKRLSASTNTFMKLESKFTEQNSSFAIDSVKRLENGTQYSTDYGKVEGCALHRSDGIGDSYLMSVRTLNRSIKDMEVQTDMAFQDHGLFEIPRSKHSSSVSTSYSLDKLFDCPKLVSAKDPPKKEQTSQAISAQKLSCNIDTDTNHQQMTSRVPSSALDAVKWIHAGYPVEVGHVTTDSCNVTNIIPHDTKSVDITTQYVDQSAEMSQTKESNPMAQETIDYVAVQTKAPSILVPTIQDSSDIKTIEGKSESNIVCSITNTIEHPENATASNVVDQPIIETNNVISVQPQGNQTTVQMVDGATSDVLVKDVKEITLQARPESCDAATECFQEKGGKSACALTSRCILPGLPFKCCEHHRYGDLSGDCRFVYGIPHCVVHTHNPEDIPCKTEPCITEPYISTLHSGKQPVQSAGSVVTGTAYNQSHNANNNKVFSSQSQFQCAHSEVEGVSFDETTKSDALIKCSCHSKLSPIHKQHSKTLDDLPMITLNTRFCSSLFKKNNKTINKLPEAATISSDKVGRAIDSASSQSQPTASQLSRKLTNTASAITSMYDKHSARSIAVMTANKPATEQQTCNITNQAPVTDGTTISNEHFERTVGQVTSCFQKNPTIHRQTSHIMSGNVSITTSMNEDQLKRSIGITTSNRQPRANMCQKHTSNIFTVASAKTSVQQQMNRAIGLITSRQNNPPIHNKACSNIIKCTSAKTSMYDELNTQSIGVVNSNLAPEYFVPENSMRLEHCVQSVGVTNATWKGRTAAKTRSPHACVTQSSEFGFLLSPKEYEALYKTTRFLSKEAAKAITAIKEGSLGHQQNSNQTDAAVEVMLRADMKSAQNMTSPDMQSATVMTAPSVAATSEYDSSAPLTPTGSDKYSMEIREIPTRDSDPCKILLDKAVTDGNVKKHLAASCRYYSTLLTKHLDTVKENLTKHLGPAPESSMELPLFTEACTMKPSAREEFGCQTFKDRVKDKPNVLDPSDNETDICRHDKEHLQSVYYMLTAIEGRLRRLKSNVEYNS